MERYKSVFMEAHIKHLWEALKSLTSILKERDINFTVIGGAARNQYGYLKVTEDIDIIVDKNDKDKLRNIPIGFMREISNGRLKKFTLHNPKTPIEVIFEGEISGDGVKGIKFENPSKISKEINGVPFMTLENLIRYKLSSGIYGEFRYKDIDDIGELIKRNNLSKDYAKKFRPDLKQKYIEIWDEVNQ